MITRDVTINELVASPTHTPERKIDQLTKVQANIPEKL